VARRSLHAFCSRASGIVDGAAAALFAAGSCCTNVWFLTGPDQFLPPFPALSRVGVIASLLSDENRWIAAKNTEAAAGYIT
jgi:hypothetical protein